ncbi:MAG: diguanylate cyclase [Planctomycetota bacterium]|nr:diguanylate cyclase [Planctomycetota bacterium]
MNSAARMLLLADPNLGAQFVAHLGADRVQTHSDPYQALDALAARPWPVVVLTAGQADFPGLCRACRGLQRDTFLLALCPPAGEPDMRALVGDGLDDYLVAPLGRADWLSLQSRLDAGLAAPAPAQPVAPPAHAPAHAPTADELAALIASVHTVQALEAELADQTARRLNAPVRWLDTAALPPGHHALLTCQLDTLRTLCCEHAAPSESAAWLSGLQTLLAPLAQAARRTESLRRLAITDHLTGAYNRRFFYHVTDQILQHARRQGLLVTLLLYDIDDFKRYNDTYGHAVGDEILRQTAALMKRITRTQDIVARIGGDEFAVLFWDTAGPRTAASSPPSTAYALADRFRQAVETQAFPSLGPVARGTLSISGGLATSPHEGRSCRELLAQADRALRAAKSAGKNQIYLVGQAL